MIFKKEKDFMLFGLEPHQSSYRGVLIFFGIYFGATLIAAILTPAVYWALHDFWPNKRVDVFFNRVRYIPIVIGLPFMIKACGLASFANLGLHFTKQNFLRFLKYFFAGVGIAAAIFAAQAIFADVSYAPMEVKSASKLLVKILFTWILGAALIGLLEEIIFRALTFRCIYTALGMVWSVLLTSAFFAYKHFRVPSDIWQNVPGKGRVAEWDTGFFIAWYDTVGVFMNWDFVKFFSLFAFGAVLSMIYVRTKVLWGPIGFHMGIVLAMFVYKANVSLNFTEEQAFFFGGTNPSSGLLSLLILMAMLTLLTALQIRNANKTNLPS